MVKNRTLRHIHIMPSPVPNAESALIKGNQTIQKRADDHARSLVEELRKEIFGSEDREANDRFWLEPEAITLKALTSHLIERGFRPPLQSGKLTLSMVDRAFKRAGVDWRDWRDFLTENTIGLIQAKGMTGDDPANRTEKSLTIRLKRRADLIATVVERVAIIRGNYTLAANGKRIATQDGDNNVRRLSADKEFSQRVANLRKCIEEIWRIDDLPERSSSDEARLTQQIESYMISFKLAFASKRQL